MTAHNKQTMRGGYGPGGKRNNQVPEASLWQRHKFTAERTVTF